MSAHPRLPIHRRAAVLVLSAILMVAILGMVAFGLDMGYIVLARTQLQASADAAAMAAAGIMAGPPAETYRVATSFAGLHTAAGKSVELHDTDVEFGTWDTNSRVFMPSADPGNALRVTCYRDANHGGAAPLFFARILGINNFTVKAQAIAMCNPRDIAFVVDLSGSMNDDTEPCWATGAVNSTFGPQGYPNIGTSLMQQVYADFNFGTYPGARQWIGEAAGIKSGDANGYANLTIDGGPLTKTTVATTYRIKAGDSEAVRKQKAYSWMIDNQIAVLMPNAKPAPSSAANYAYWEKYLDYIIISKNYPAASTGTGSSGGSTGGGSSSGGSSSGGSSSGGSSSGGSSSGGGSTTTPTPTPPKPPLGWRNPLRAGDATLALGLSGSGWRGLLADQVLGQTNTGRGTIPPSQDADRIDQFNNPNTSTFPSISISVPRGFRNYIGYQTYVQFMMDHGRDLQPVGTTYTPISIQSALCPWHSESTAGGSFSFPPRAQPEHSSRRALIAAMQVVKDRNHTIPDFNNRDWVSVISFDGMQNGGPAIAQRLTGDYDAAMLACTRLQAVGDKGATTATEAGLIKAQQHLAPAKQGGAARDKTNKTVVLLTDGVPNLYSSSASTITGFIAQDSTGEFYANGAHWYDAALMQAANIKAKKWQLYPVGIGLGTDYDFMDRMARIAGTADAAGHSPRGSGNPAEYEQKLIQIFEEIIKTPQVRLVQ